MVFAVDEDRSAFFLGRKKAAGDPVDALLSSDDGELELGKANRQNMADLVLTVISETLDEISEAQDRCIVIE